MGADLANLVNEAALRAVRMGRQAVNQNDLLVSFEVVIAGAEKKGTVLTEKEKKLIAYHEVGHALVAARQKNTQPGQQDHHRAPHPGRPGLHHADARRRRSSSRIREELLADLRTLLGGRAAEWAGVPHHDHRRIQRHRAGHRPGPEDGHHVRHERPLRRHGPWPPSRISIWTAARA